MLTKALTKQIALISEENLLTSQASLAHTWLQCHTTVLDRKAVTCAESSHGYYVGACAHTHPPHPHTPTHHTHTGSEW